VLKPHAVADMLMHSIQSNWDCSFKTAAVERSAMLILCHIRSYYVAMYISRSNVED
jgi:hypothetical protein